MSEVLSKGYQLNDSKGYQLYDFVSVTFQKRQIYREKKTDQWLPGVGYDGGRA